MNLNEIEQRIFDIKDDSSFEELALLVFKQQYKSCSIYQQYCDLLSIIPSNVKSILDIPFLPIQFFKKHKITSGNFKEESIFSSSGTTGSQTSKHFVKDLNLYKSSFLTAFNQFYPDWENSAIIGLLPSYLERKGSSLIYMVDYLIKNSNNNGSKFQLSPDEDFIHYLETNDEPKIIFGVTFALLDLSDRGIKPKNAIILETGGMKGRGKELTREELHSVLQRNLSPKAIHSEYGMTELLSQAYLQKDSFQSPNWMKAFIRDTTDPLTVRKVGKGALNIIDLANLHSCSFIATDDLGEVNTNGSFKVSGRIDHSQIRGCNLLVI